MTLREKIAARERENKTDGGLRKSLWRMFFMIMGGYVGGTIIGEILRGLIRG